jgi:hypothetical protein
MRDVLISSEHLLERLGREEQHLKQLGLHSQAAGIRSAITILIREVAEGEPERPPPPIEPST